MNEWVASRPVEHSATLHERYWVAAILLFGVGDVVTTSVGLGIGGLSEIGPFTAPLLQQYGLGAMVGLKLAAFGGFYLLWRTVPRPHCAGVPLGLALLGASVTAWNLLLLGFATVV